MFSDGPLGAGQAPELYLRGEDETETESRWGSKVSGGRGFRVPWSELLGDLDGDGEVEYAVRDWGRVRVHERGENDALFVIDGEYLEIGPVDDVDRDGVTDLWVARSRGTAGVLSGTDGRELAALDGASLPRSVEKNVISSFPDGVAVVADADADGDGLRDLLVSAMEPFGLGVVGLFSSASGKLLRAHQGPPSWTNLGSAVACGVDLNGDGVEDPVVSRVEPASNTEGRVYVVDGVTGSVLRRYTRAALGG